MYVWRDEKEEKKTEEREEIRGLFQSTTQRFSFIGRQRLLVRVICTGYPIILTRLVTVKLESEELVFECLKTFLRATEWCLYVKRPL